MKKIIHCALVLTLLLSVLLPMNAFAATTVTPASFETDPGFTKNLIYDKDASIPTCSFAYTIVPGEKADATENTYAVYPGVKKSGRPTVESVSFSSADESSAVAGSSTSTVTTDTTKKYVSKDLAIDFTGVTFTQPGVYRYIITETKDTAAYPQISYDGAETRTLDVYVVNKPDGTPALEIQDTRLYSGTVTAGAPRSGSAPAEKSTGYTNRVETVSLGFGKTVSGNRGSKDKYFKISVSLSGLGSGTRLTVDLNGTAQAPEQTDATTYPAAAMSGVNLGNNIASLTANASGAVSHDFYLSNNDSIIIKNIPKGAKYSVTEAPEGYTPSLTINGTSVPVVNNGTDISTGAGTSDATVEARTLTDNTTVMFNNDLTGTVPTGVMLTVIPGMLITAAAAAGLLILRGRRKEG